MIALLTRVCAKVALSVFSRTSVQPKLDRISAIRELVWIKFGSTLPLLFIGSSILDSLRRFVLSSNYGFFTFSHSCTVCMIL